MIDWRRKLTSRKFSDIAETVETVSGCIMSAASVIAYIIGEGMADSATAGAVEMVVEQDAPDLTDDGK